MEWYKFVIKSFAASFWHKFKYDFDTSMTLSLK